MTYKKFYETYYYNYQLENEGDLPSYYKLMGVYEGKGSSTETDTYNNDDFVYLQINENSLLKVKVGKMLDSLQMMPYKLFTVMDGHVKGDLTKEFIESHYNNIINNIQSYGDKDFDKYGYDDFVNDCYETQIQHLEEEGGDSYTNEKEMFDSMKKEAFENLTYSKEAAIDILEEYERLEN